MAQGSTIRQFDIELSDVDRHVYEALSVKAAQHPSETGEYLVARVLAYALEFEEGLGFTAGLGASEEPALQSRDLTGQLRAWIEVGTPDSARLHRASKAAGRVVVYCHKDPDSWLRLLARDKVHASDQITLIGLPPADVAALAAVLERRNTWSILHMEDTLTIGIGDTTYKLSLARIPWPEG